MVTVKVERFNGEDEVISVEVFDATDIANKMNDSSVIAILIGQQVFSRIDIKHVKTIM